MVSPLTLAFERALNALWVRVALSLLILASLLPHADDALTDLVFLAIFGVELALRAVVIHARRGERDVRATRRRALSVASLVIDLVALLTFVPWGGLAGALGATGLVGEVRWLRLLRLLRLVLLLGYWAPILRDTWQVLTRHERIRQVALLGLTVMLFAFVGAVVLSHLPAAGTDFDANGLVDAADEAFWPRLWWAFRQVQDAGNLVDSPAELTVVALSLLLTVAGIFVVSFLIGLATDVVRELVAIARNRPVGWKGHTVIVHATPGLPRLLGELGAYYEKLFRRPRFVVAGTTEEPPAALRSGELAHVRWRQIDERGEGLTAHTDMAEARRVVVLSKAGAPYPDAQAAATVLDAREANAAAWVVVEVLDPNNVAAVRVAGGARTVVVATEKLFGIWALAAVRRPEQLGVAWDLLATRGGCEVYTCYYDADGLPGLGAPWTPGGPARDFAALVADALALGPTAQEPGGVVPIGVVYRREADRDGAAPEDGELVLGPRVIEPRPVRALVAIGEHFRSVERVAHALHRGSLPRAAGAPERPLALTQGPAAVRARRVLVCGFRPATAIVCAGLLADDDQVAITLVMRHEESVREAAQTFREHGLGEARGPCFAGRFEGDGQRFAWVPEGGARSRGEVTLVQADWTSERTLSGFEPGVEHASAYDLVLLLGSHLPEYDGRSAMACLKIADLARLGPGRFQRGARVIAGISDAELGRRLGESFARAVGPDGPTLAVLPAEDLRALFVFQSIAVPGWEAIFLELLGPGGKGFVRRPLAAGASGRAWRYGELASAVRGDGVLIGVELGGAAGPSRVYAAPPDAGPFAADAITAVWLLADDV